MASGERLGMVVNFYAGRADAATRDLLVDATSIGLRLLARAPIVDRVLLVDGTPAPCERMRLACDTIGAQYLHAGRELTYVEAYNLGWQRLDHAFIGLMANDVLPHPATALTRLVEVLQHEDVGCVFPYLATARLANDETQQPGFGRGRISCEPASMTLNLNLFRRSVLEAIGGLDPHYLVGYQEPILLHKIRTLGYRAVLVGNTRALHFDGLNKATGSTTTTRPQIDADTARWRGEYPQYASETGIAQLKFWPWPFATTRRASAAWWLAHHLPGRFRARALRGVMAIEPHLCRYPASRGRRYPP